MTEPLTWREGWALGIDLLDDEHREMVRLINRLLESDEPTPLTQRLDALIAQLRRHFETEEVFLRAIDFPGAEDHAREHTMQLAEFVDLRRSVSRDKATSLDPADQESIRQWFFEHVIGEDKRFAIYYRETVCGQ